MVVPPEYRAAGSPPASWFIDDLMRHLGQPYYVGLLSAAAIHGAAHQQPLVVQVVTSKSTRPVRVGRVVIRFSMSNRVEQLPATKLNTETGTMRVATSETTAFDLVRYPSAAGHLSNVATVLSELSARLDAATLTAIAPLVRVPDVQRLGYLLEAVGQGQLAEPLAAWLAKQKPRAVPLHPARAAGVVPDGRWDGRTHVELEPDL